MKSLKNKFKIILVILLIAIIAGGISGYATYNYLSKDVVYTKPDGTTINVEIALNELYQKNNQEIIDNLEKLTDGINSEGDYFYIYNPDKIKWNETQLDNVNCFKKVVYCYKTAGNNKNFTATLPFNIDGANMQVQLIKKTNNQGWKPIIIGASGNNIDIDLNYGYPEIDEYYFAVLIK